MVLLRCARERPVRTKDTSSRLLNPTCRSIDQSERGWGEKRVSGPRINNESDEGGDKQWYKKVECPCNKISLLHVNISSL